MLCSSNLLHGSVHGNSDDTISDGNGNPSFLPDVSWYDLCTFLASSLGLPMDSIAVLIGIDWFAGMFRTLMNVDIDVMIGLLVASKLGELDRDVYDEKKTVTY